MAKDFKYGDTVWAKMKGYPFWPGIITDPLKEMKIPSKVNLRCVYFFGTKNYSWIDISNLKDYESNKLEFGNSNKTSLKLAIEDIEQFLKRGGDPKLLSKEDSFDELVAVSKAPKRSIKRKSSVGGANEVLPLKKKIKKETKAEIKKKETEETKKKGLGSKTEQFKKSKDVKEVKAVKKKKKEEKNVKMKNEGAKNLKKEVAKNVIKEEAKSVKKKEAKIVRKEEANNLKKKEAKNIKKEIAKKVKKKKDIEEMKKKGIKVMMAKKQTTGKKNNQIKGIESKETKVKDKKETVQKKKKIMKGKVNKKETDIKKETKKIQEKKKMKELKRKQLKLKMEEVKTMIRTELKFTKNRMVLLRQKLKRKRIRQRSRSTSPIQTITIRNTYSYLSRPTTGKAEVEPLDLSKCSEELIKKEIKPSSLVFGFIGLGVKGSRLLKNIVYSKHNVIIWNRTSSKCEQFENIGVKVAQSPYEVASSADIIFLCLGINEATIVDLLFGSDLSVAIKSGSKSFVNLSNISDVDVLTHVTDYMEAFQCRYLEVRTMGTIEDADKGLVNSFAAGDRTLYDESLSCIISFSEDYNYLGESIKELNGLHYIQNAMTAIALKSISTSLRLVKRSGNSVSQFLGCLLVSYFLDEAFVHKFMSETKGGTALELLRETEWFNTTIRNLNFFTDRNIAFLTSSFDPYF